MKKAVVFLADGLEEIEGLTVVDLLRRAGVQVTMVSIKEKERMVTGAHDIVIQADCCFEDVDFADKDLLVLPGGTFYAVSVLGLLLLAGLLYLLCYTVFSCAAQHGGEIRPMTLLYGANQVPIRALHDTGCTLRDPMTGERVLVAETGALQALLPDVPITRQDSPASWAAPAKRPAARTAPLRRTARRTRRQPAGADAQFCRRRASPHR